MNVNLAAKLTKATLKYIEITKEFLKTVVDLRDTLSPRSDKYIFCEFLC